VIISRKMIWAVHVKFMGTEYVHAGFWWSDLPERNDLKDLGLDGRMLLKLMFKYCDEGWTGVICLRIGTGGGLL
jgi:hypothetical protein